jgi:hypothetical protein
MFVHTWIINFEYIFKIYNFFWGSNQIPLLPHKIFWVNKGTSRYPLVTPMFWMVKNNIFSWRSPLIGNRIPTAYWDSKRWYYGVCTLTVFTGGTGRLGSRVSTDANFFVANPTSTYGAWKKNELIIKNVRVVIPSGRVRSGENRVVRYGSIVTRAQCTRRGLPGNFFSGGVRGYTALYFRRIYFTK